MRPAVVRLRLPLDQLHQLVVCQVSTVLEQDARGHGGQVVLGQRGDVGLPRADHLDLVRKVPDVGQVGGAHQERETEQGDSAFPDLDDVRGVELYDHQQPYIGCDREERRDSKDAGVFDVAHLAPGDAAHADGRDDVEVEGRAAYDRRGPQVPGHHHRRQKGQLDDAQEDLGGAGPQRHKRQVRDGVVPNLYCDDSPVGLIVHALLLGCDPLDGAHEDVADNGDSHEQPQEPRQVQQGPERIRPLLLAVAPQRWQEEALAPGLADGGLASGAGVCGRHPRC
mmetsp:Transcript_89173/g.273084  ORF Transcript_89173/g.273084 Transcript_89173/m.273084 type:complete len:281 (+) Transcript_89173:1821-2663(+)